MEKVKDPELGTTGAFAGAGEWKWPELYSLDDSPVG